MDIWQQHRLEPIQEESEQEDEIEGSKTGEGDEEEFRIQVGVETKEATDESEEDEDDAAQLRVMRPRRLSRSLSQEGFRKLQPTHSRQEAMENSSASEWSSHLMDLRGEATPTRQARVGNKRRPSSGKRRRKVSKVRRQKRSQLKPSVERKRKKNMSLAEEFPEWLVNLMVNIEEATTHQLLVE